MNKRRRYSVLSLLVVIALLMTVLTGCSKESQTTIATTVEPTVAITSAPSDAPAPALTEKPTASPTTPPTNTPEPVADNSASKLNDTQRNSIAMLNYLTVLMQEINASKNSRLYLEEAYSSLINNTYPNAVDNRTLAQLGGILDTLEDYRMIAVKRDRLQYIYEQNRAQALREAVPNPLGLLSAVQSFSLSKIAASIVYMAVDSYTSYTTYTAQADLQYLKDGWALDDNEATTLHNSRKDAFNYMVKIVGEKDLPGDLALNENSVDEFVTRKNSSNVIQRIQFLESNKETFRALGAYWLILAESYYIEGDYTKCLEAVSTYESLGTRIYRKDYGLAKVLPLAIVAAGETKIETEYVEIAEQYGKYILLNTDNDEWALRYFVAQTYVDLFAKTSDTWHLEAAYGIVLDNVNYLVNKQNTMNAEYLSEVTETVISKDATKDEKAEIENYNKQLKEERKTALAPIYEPLLLNCDLLFSLAQELDIADGEKTKIDRILHENGENIFLVPLIDAKYRFAPASEELVAKVIEVSFNGKELSIPTKYVSGDALITVTVTDPDSDAPVVFVDWEMLKVERKDNTDIDSFTVTFKSPTAEKHKYSIGAMIKIEITPKKDIVSNTLNFSFTTLNDKEEWWEFVKVWEDGIGFQRTE